MPILSLCIPTYNRSALLGEALDAIVGQLDADATAQVEIVIADNDSPDDTEAFVTRFQAAHPDAPIVYFRQPQNLGGDANVNTLLKLAHGDYLYILSDDDILLPGAIAKLLTSLRADPPYDAVCLNLCTFANTPDQASAPIFALPQDQVFRGREASLAFLSTWLTFLSAMAFRRERIANKDYADKIGSYFLHSHAFVDALSPNGIMLVTAEPFLAVRSNNTGVYSFFQTFLTRFANVLAYAESIGYSRKATREALARHRPFILGFVLTFKIHGGYGQLKPDYWDGIRRLIQVYGHDPLFLIRVIPLMLLPQSAVLFARRVRWLIQGRSTA